MRQVTAAVIIENGRMLLTRRPPGDPLAGMWELPGGKIEPGETPQECVERELLEELEMTCRAGHIIAQTTYDYEHGSFEILALEVQRLSNFVLKNHDATVWAKLERLADYVLAPADITLISQIVPGASPHRDRPGAH